MSSAHATFALIFDEQARRYHKPTWIALVIFILCLADYYRVMQVVAFKRDYRIVNESGEQIGVYHVDDATDTKLYRQAANGEFPFMTLKNMTAFIYPKFTAAFWKPMTWISLPTARVLNHLVLSLCIVWMAWKVIAFPGGWLIAIFGAMAAKYSLDYGNVYPLLCALSMTFCGGCIALLIKPYMAIFPIIHILTRYTSIDSKKLKIILISIALISAGICSLLCAKGGLRTILLEEPTEFFIHKRQGILVFPSYYLLWKYIPKNWWQ